VELYLWVPERLHGKFVFRSVSAVPKGAPYLRHVRPSVLVHQRGSQWTDFNEIYMEDFYLKKKKIGQEIPNWVKIGQKYLGLYMKIDEDL